MTTQTVGWQEKELSGRPIESEEQLDEAHAVYYQRGWYNSWVGSVTYIPERVHTAASKPTGYEAGCFIPSLPSRMILVGSRISWLASVALDLKFALLTVIPPLCCSYVVLLILRKYSKGLWLFVRNFPEVRGCIVKNGGSFSSH